MRDPEPAEGAGQLELGVRVVSRKPLERGTKVVVVGLEALRALGFGLHAPRITLGGERAKCVCVAAPQLLGFGRSLELLGGVFPDRLQHQEAILGDRLQQAEVDERRHRVEVRVADLLGDRERKAPEKDRETREETFRAFVEEVVAPFDRRPERSLPFGGVARAAGEQRQSAIEALQERLRAEELRASSGQLDRQRQAVQAKTDGLDRWTGREVLSGPAGSLEEERHSILRRERLESVLALPGDPQRRSARHDHTEPVSSGEEGARSGAAASRCSKLSSSSSRCFPRR